MCTCSMHSHFKEILNHLLFSSKKGRRFNFVITWIITTVSEMYLWSLLENDCLEKILKLYKSCSNKLQCVRFEVIGTVDQNTRYALCHIRFLIHVIYCSVDPSSFLRTKSAQQENNSSNFTFQEELLTKLYPEYILKIFHYFKQTCVWQRQQDNEIFRTIKLKYLWTHVSVFIKHRYLESVISYAVHHTWINFDFIFFLRNGKFYGGNFRSEP